MYNLKEITVIASELAPLDSERELIAEELWNSLNRMDKVLSKNIKSIHYRKGYLAKELIKNCLYEHKSKINGIEYLILVKKDGHYDNNTTFKLYIVRLADTNYCTLDIYLREEDDPYFSINKRKLSELCILHNLFRVRELKGSSCNSATVSLSVTKL